MRPRRSLGANATISAMARWNNLIRGWWYLELCGMVILLVLLFVFW